MHLTLTHLLEGSRGYEQVSTIFLIRFGRTKVQSDCVKLSSESCKGDNTPLTQMQ